MAQATQNYKRTLGGSVGSGMGSVFGGGGKRYYILEHKTSSQYHAAGDTQRIIVDQIEIGRDPKAQVRYDESFSTVSRKHAAIVRDGENWKLMQLSATNPTFLNGRAVEGEWFLQNGDEIQLSTNGPKLGFILPQGDKGLVKSIGMTARLNLFRDQALRPYKMAVTLLAVILILAIGGLTAWKILGDQESAKKIDGLVDEIETTREQNIPPDYAKLIEATFPDVYYIVAKKVEITIPGQEVKVIDKGWTGAGFLLEDGRFVTSRDVIEPWYYIASKGIIEENMRDLNRAAYNGRKIVVHFEAFSSTGAHLTFTNERFDFNKTYDTVIKNDRGTKIVVTNNDASNWAYFKTDKRGGLKFDSSKSNNLETKTELYVLGFPLGHGASSTNRINPIYSSSSVSTTGLSEVGTILTNNSIFENGSSGGPVFYLDPATRNLVVVGLVSARVGRSMGYVVPISAIR